MGMEKRNEVKVGRTLCDYCSKPATRVDPGGESLCSACAQSISQLEKEAAEAPQPLKNSPTRLSKSIR